MTFLAPGSLLFEVDQGGFAAGGEGSFGLLPQFVLPGASLQFDFVNNQAWNGGAVVTPASLLTVSRASTCMIDDLAGNWTEIPANTLCRSNKGVTSWEARTNSVRNNTMIGVANGSPGTLPTNWTIGLAGLTQTVVGSGVVNGLEYVDLRFNGTTSGVEIVIGLEGNQVIAALQNQAWTVSSFLALVAGSLTNVTATQLQVIERNAAGGVLASQQTAVTLNSSLARRDASFTMGNASTAFVSPRVRLAVTSGTAVDITIRIALPGIELGLGASPPIRTLGAAALRAADVITMPIASGPAYSLSGDAIPGVPTAFAADQNIVSINDGTANNYFRLYRLAGTQFSRFAYAVAASVAGASPAATWVIGVSGKLTAAAESGAQAMSFNRGVPVTSALAGVPVVSTIYIGSDINSSLFMNGTIQSVTLWRSKVQGITVI